MQENFSPDDCDPSDFFEAARDEAVEFYQLMHDTRQGLVNGFAASLYHLFEQQLCQFCRLIAWDKKAVLRGAEVESKLRHYGPDVTRFPEWASLYELRLLANCASTLKGMHASN